MVRALIRRYIMNEQRIQERQRGVTEDDCNEIKQEVSALRYDLLEMLGSHRRSKHGFDTVLSNGSNSNCHMGKKSRQRERRLMKGFNFDHPIVENDNQENVTSFEINEDFEDKSSTNISDSQKTSIRSSTSVIKNKFYRTAQNFVQNKKTHSRWRQMIETKREKVKTFSQSQDSIESDATMNTDGSYGNNTIDSRMVIDANIKRQIFARKLDSMSLSQPIMLSLQQQQQQQHNQTMTNKSIVNKSGSFSNETIKSQSMMIKDDDKTTTDEDSHWI